MNNESGQDVSFYRNNVSNAEARNLLGIARKNKLFL